MNLAEIGHGLYKQDYQLFLISVAYDDIISIVMHNTDYEEFMAGNT